MSLSSIVLLVFLGTRVSAQYDQCAGYTPLIGDGRCHASNNNVECGYDGGDCCFCSCFDSEEYTCDIAYLDCRDPAYLGGEVSDCGGEQVVDVPCFTDAAIQWTVNDTASADALADAIRCSGGVFDVQWVGHVAVTRTIEVANRTVLNVTGLGLGAEMQAAPGTRLITLINASLDMSSMKIAGGYATFGGAIAAVDSYITLENTSFSGNGALVEGGAIYATFSSIDVRGESILFSGNYAVGKGGALSIRGGRNVMFHGKTSFTSNTADNDGGALYVYDSRVSWAGDAFFSNNTANYDGGALYLDSSTVSWAGDVFVSNNTADASGGALSISSSTVSWAGDALFFNNIGNDWGGALHVWDSIVSFASDTDFSKNTAKGWGGALDISSSTVSWAGDSFFFDNTAGDLGGASGDAVSSNSTPNLGGALHVWDSTLSWGRDAVFSNNTATDWGGAIDIASSTATWAGGATFSNNTANELGGAVHVWNSTLSWVGDTVFSLNTAHDRGGALDVASSTISWTGDTLFSNNTASDRGGALEVWDSTVSLVGDAVFSNNVASDRGGAVGISSSTVSWESNATFLDNASTDRGGALFVHSSSASWAGEAVFSDNAAIEGGGALYASSSTLSWRAPAVFLNNSAGKNGGALYITRGARIALELGILLLHNSASGDGGAISIYGSDEGRPSSVCINRTAEFLNNLCGGDGGAIVVMAASSVTFATERVTFSHNSAHAAGGAVAVKGLTVGPKFTGLTFLSNRAQIGGAAYVTSSGTATTEDELRDPIQNPTTFDRCKFIDNEASATGGAIDTGAGLDVISNTYFAGNGARAGGALRLAGIASLHNCTFTENTSGKNEGPAISNVGFVSSMTACSFQNNAFMCKPGEFLDYEEMTTVSGVFNVVCRGCNAECQQCITSRQTPVCVEELKHTKSMGGNATIEDLEINQGYWRATDISKNVLSCYNAGACLGGVTGASNYCSAGYEGPYCSICRAGYSPGIGHTCSRCSGSIGSIVVTVIIAISAILFVFTLVSNMINGKSTGAAQGLLASWRRRLSSLKMIVIVWQILSQFASVADITYPGVYQRFLDGIGILNFDLGWVLSAECAIDIDFHHRLIVNTLGPLVALTIIGGMYAMTMRRNRPSCDDLLVTSQEEVRRKYLSLVLLVTFLVYSPVSSTLFRTYACDELDDGKSYLRADYRIDCNSSVHRYLQLYAGFMMVTFTGGVPALYGTLLLRNRQVLMNERARQEDAVAKSISHLWELYKPNRYYYELIECARRILVAGVVVFIFPNTTAQVGITLIIAAFFMVLSEMLASFESVWDAWLNRIGHAIIFNSIYLAFLLKIDVSDEREDSQSIFEAILLAAHACMFFFAMFEGVVVTFQWIRRVE